MAAQREPLMLPAPVETIEIPRMTTIPARDEMSAVSVHAAIASLAVKSLAA